MKHVDADVVPPLTPVRLKDKTRPRPGNRAAVDAVRLAFAEGCTLPAIPHGVYSCDTFRRLAD